MFFAITYGLAAAGTAFGLTWLVNKIRDKDKRFLMDGLDDASYIVCGASAAFWPILAPIAFGIIGAKYLFSKED